MDRSSGEFGRWLLESLGSGVVAIDGRGGVVALNAGARRILGIPSGADAVGRDCRELLAAQPRVAALLLDALDGRSGFSRAELALEPGAGASAIGFTLFPVRDEDGAVRGAAVLFRDLAPIEASSEQERLRERLAALGQMAAGLAHEIRNPLAGMEVVAGLLKRRLADRPEERELVERITGELRSVADTVTASLEFVRPRAPSRAAVEPVALLEEALAVAQSRVAHAVRVERCYAAEPPPVDVDPEQLRDVLADLIVNALEALRDAGTEAPRLALGLEVGRRGARPVRLDAGAAGDPREGHAEVAIRIADNGPGVPADLREKVFYPFFTTKQRGSGLGLANAQKVMASHGGSIGFEPGPGTGCGVTLRLPVAERAARDAHAGGAVRGAP